jgi:hypothetical protein
VTIIYQDSDLTITKDFIRSIYTRREVIPMDTITGAQVGQEVTKDYKQGAVLFFLLGILTVWFAIGFLFIALGIGAWNYKEYRYTLYLVSRGDVLPVKVSTSKRKLKSLANTIIGIVWTKSVQSNDKTLVKT